MLYELENTSKVKELFAGWNETLIFFMSSKDYGHHHIHDIVKA